MKPDDALLAALEDPLSGEEDGDAGLLTLDELADRSDLSVSVLEAFEREGLLVPRTDGARRYAAADAEMLRTGLALIEAGVPLGELLELARRADAALRELADHAVELFAQFVRDPIRGTSASDEEAAERLVEAFHVMLPAMERLVASHTRRLVTERARRRLADDAGGST